MLKFKIALLISLFMVVSYFIYGFNTGQITLNDPNKLNWCFTRVIEVAETNSILSYRIFQEGRNWTLEQPDPPKKITIPTPHFEKWLGEHCEIALDEKLTEPPTPQGLGVLKVRLLNGQTFKFERFSGGIHKFEGMWFKSNEWELALSRLGSMENPDPQRVAF